MASNELLTSTLYFSLPLRSLPLPKGGLDKLSEQGMGFHRFRSEFRMELASEKPGMVFQFDHLHQSLIGRYAAEDQPCLFQDLHVGIIKFITMPVSLIDQLLAISLMGNGFPLRADRDRVPTSWSRPSPYPGSVSERSGCDPSILPRDRSPDGEC